MLENTSTSSNVNGQKFAPLLVVAVGLFSYYNRVMTSHFGNVVASGVDHHNLTPQICHPVSEETWRMSRLCRRLRLE